MSKYTEELDSNNAICPYCGGSYQVEGEDYSEDENQETCGDCGKNYWLSSSLSVNHTTRPDCGINAGVHNFETLIFSDGRSADFCTICDQCRLSS